MGTGITLAELLTEVADAIRNKSNTTDPIIAEDFPSVIREMQAGSGIEMYSSLDEMNATTATSGQLAIVYNGTSYSGLYEYNGSSYVEIPRA